MPVTVSYRSTFSLVCLSIVFLWVECEIFSWGSYVLSFFLCGLSVLFTFTFSDIGTVSNSVLIMSSLLNFLEHCFMSLEISVPLLHFGRIFRGQFPLFHYQKVILAVASMNRILSLFPCIFFKKQSCPVFTRSHDLSNSSNEMTQYNFENDIECRRFYFIKQCK